MAKRKHWKKTKSDAADRKSASGPAPWSDLEQTFFASAPPDEPEAPAAPDTFDDLFPAAASARPGRDLARRLIAVIAAPRLDHRIITTAIASVMFLLGLSAVVFASLH